MSSHRSFKHPAPAGSPSSPGWHSGGRPEVVSPGGHYDAGSRRSSHSPSRSQGRSHSRSRSRRGESQGRSSRSKRRERSRSRSSHGSRRSRSRSQSQPQREAPQGSYTKGAAPSGRDSRSGLPGFDTRDRAPEDRMQHQTSTPYEADDRRSSQALVRGALRIEGVDFSKYEGLKEQPDLQRMFTTALRDDLISEGGNGMTRDDIMLRLSPGPIRTVVLDYNTQGAKRSGRPAAPSLVDAEWSMDVEYAISARDEHAQQNIARNLFESLSSQQMHLKSARTAYVRYVHAEGDPYKIVAVPCSTPADETHSSPHSGGGGSVPRQYYHSPAHSSPHCSPQAPVYSSHSTQQPSVGSPYRMHSQGGYSSQQYHSDPPYSPSKSPYQTGPYDSSYTQPSGYAVGRVSPRRGGRY